MILNATACQRVKVKAMSVCWGPDRGHKVSVRVRSPGDPKSVFVLCIGNRFHYFGAKQTER